MTYQNNDIAQAIMQVQRFLRILQIGGEGRVTVPIDGIYDNVTVEAVKLFQKENELEENGIVDKVTYDLLYEKTLEAEFEQSEPLPIYIFKKGQSVSIGEKSDFVMLLQMLLNSITVIYDDYAPLELTGEYNETTENAVAIFQLRNNISSTGIVDKITWNAIVRNYNAISENLQ